MLIGDTVYSRSNWNLEVLVFMEGGKPENPEKNPQSKDENQQQTQPTYGTGPESNPGHIGGRRALSPLRHPCSPNLVRIQLTFQEKIGSLLIKNRIMRRVRISSYGCTWKGSRAQEMRNSCSRRYPRVTVAS